MFVCLLVNALKPRILKLGVENHFDNGLDKFEGCGQRLRSPGLKRNSKGFSLEYFDVGDLIQITGL